MAGTDTDLSGLRVAFLVAPKGTEHVELMEPLEAVRQAGAKTVLVSTEKGPVQTNRHDTEPGETLQAELSSTDADADFFDAVVIPGGAVGSDKLRTDPKLVSFVRDFFEQDKPVAAICHAPWVLVEADEVKGRRLTSYPSLQTDVRNAGGDWVDEEVVVDGRLVTSRMPDDIPAFIDKTLQVIAAGRTDAAHGR